MLVFIIPLQGTLASRSWQQVSLLAVRTLKSALAQDHPDFRVLLVCNERPIGCPSHPALQVIDRDFSAIEANSSASRMADKWRKVRVGLVAAREYAPCHIIIMDADDCVSNQLAGYAALHPDRDGWVFDSGWVHEEGSRWILWRRHRFDAVCGTSSILHVLPAQFPDREEGGREDNFILSSGHTKIRCNMLNAGKPLQDLPFPGAIYNLATGENHSHFFPGSWKEREFRKLQVKKFLRYRWLTRRIQREFGLYDLPPLPCR